MLVFIVNIYIIIYCFQSISTINLSLKRICIDYFYLTMDYANICMKCLKIPKECSEAVNLTRTDNANAKRKRTKLQTMIIYKLLHSKLKIEQHELFKENGRVGNSYSTSGTRHVPVKQREYQLMQLTWHPFTCHWVTIGISYLQLSSIVYDSPLKTKFISFWWDICTNASWKVPKHCSFRSNQIWPPRIQNSGRNINKISPSVT